MFIYEPCLDRCNEGCNSLEVEYMFPIKHVSKGGKAGGGFGAKHPLPRYIKFGEFS